MKNKYRFFNVGSFVILATMLILLLLLCANPIKVDTYFHYNNNVADYVAPHTVQEMSVFEMYYPMNEADIEFFATCVYLEGGTESYECQKGIASVILNRMEIYKMSLQDVIYSPGQFSIVPYIEGTTPSDSCRNAVKEVITSGPIFPSNVLFFRAGHYFQWNVNWLHPYCNLDHTYFSLDSRYDSEIS